MKATGCRSSLEYTSFQLVLQQQNKGIKIDRMDKIDRMNKVQKIGLKHT